ncbi:hypothetical protein JOM56_014363 [Amanita muscaria]
MSIYMLRKQLVPECQRHGLKGLVEEAVHFWAKDIREVFGDAQATWVIMGGAHKSPLFSGSVNKSPGEQRDHWTVRGFNDGCAKYTLHVIKDAHESSAHHGAGKWGERKLDLEKEYDDVLVCRQEGKFDFHNSGLLRYSTQLETKPTMDP